MSELTPQQEHAKATFKSNIHLPGGGFHTLIIEKSKEFQLPFQKVRSVVMSAQKAVERKIREDFQNMDEAELTKESWFDAINVALIDLAKTNQSVMDILATNQNYIHAQTALKASIKSEGERNELLENLFLAYEKVVFKPLLAMLHTSPLYWKLMLLEELYQMTEEKRQQFELYPQYMQATETLFILDQKIRNIELVDSL
ncbi:hypothetical protein L4C54_12650 [Vibrio lamellibrachiae]|uniref:hypothetical protein n=1 Tax=Vibrio lamellibrachiae TaxID=2910253 RepID=UPI003D10FFCA